MPEYIEREAVKKRLELRRRWLELDEHDEYSQGLFHGCEADIEIVDEIPAADVVAVVRCKDCKFQGDEDDCPLLSLSAYTEPDDFCSYGERRGEDG
jgi:hypothetical protein